ncbi:hypothetical protein C8Q70DRAFT_1128762 [Cubamyces menziesii]|nr:hypothetical protein C8Q70DRAFT_1128762 [Cubamyces menziesii]
MTDSGLASDLCKLLRDELGSVRAQIEARQRNKQVAPRKRSASVVDAAQLSALQAENARLKAEVETARADVAQVNPMLDQDRRITHNVNSADLDEQRARMDNLHVQIQSLEHKLMRRLEKHDKITEAIMQLTQAINEARQQVNSVKMQHTEERNRLQILQAELRDRQANQEFDPLRFLRDPQLQSHSENAASVAVRIPSTSMAFTLPKAAADRCTPCGYMTKNRDEVVWPNGSSTKSHFVSLNTTHRYNPKLNNAGGWEVSWDIERRNGARDLFYLEDRTWHYLGTYEFVGQAILPSGEIRGLLHSHMHHLRKRAFLFSEMLPPALTGIAEGMLDGGALKITCTGWRRIGFNDHLAKALHGGQGEAAIYSNVRDRPSAQRAPEWVPKEGSRVIPEIVDEDEQSGMEERPRKKQKKAVQKAQQKAGQKSQKNANKKAQKKANKKAQRRARRKERQRAKQKVQHKEKHKTHWSVDCSHNIASESCSSSSSGRCM